MPILLDDKRLIIDGHTVIELVEGGTVRWRDSFGKGEYALEVESDEMGDMLAAAVPNYVGGSVIPLTNRIFWSGDTASASNVAGCGIGNKSGAVGPVTAVACRRSRPLWRTTQTASGAHISGSNT